EKLAGILIEKSNQKFVIGIGVNVNQKAIPETDASSFSASSVYMKSGNELDQQSLMIQIVQRLMHCQNDSSRSAESNSRLLNAIQRRLLFLDRQVEIGFSDGTSTLGVFKGVNRQGAAVLETSKGLQEIFSGTLRSSPS
ncbi:MAG: hypothetical protein AAF939_13920, partial [Planctomycetota bacterium]